MKLLEERTEASKFEMDRMEALEELQELNKRELKVNYEDLLGRYSGFADCTFPEIVKHPLKALLLQLMILIMNVLIS